MYSKKERLVTGGTREANVQIQDRENIISSVHISHFCSWMRRLRQECECREPWQSANPAYSDLRNSTGRLYPRFSQLHGYHRNIQQGDESGHNQHLYVYLDLWRDDRVWASYLLCGDQYRHLYTLGWSCTEHFYRHDYHRGEGHVRHCAGG